MLSKNGLEKKGLVVPIGESLGKRVEEGVRVLDRS
jgi:hypothetical protein